MGAGRHIRSGGRPPGRPDRLADRLAFPTALPRIAFMLPPLPIAPFLPEIAATLASAGALVLQAEPGAGKTTRVPPALLAAGAAGEIVVLEPRRIAARLAARRVAA